MALSLIPAFLQVIYTSTLQNKAKKDTQHFRWVVLFKSYAAGSLGKTRGTRLSKIPKMTETVNVA